MGEGRKNASCWKKVKLTFTREKLGCVPEWLLKRTVGRCV